MNKTAAEITAAVRTVLDEIQTQSADFLMGADNADLDAIILSRLPSATEFCVLHADPLLLTPDTILKKTNTLNQIVFEDVTDSVRNRPTDKVAWVGKATVNKAVLRLCHAWVSSWSRRVTEAVTDRDAAAVAALGNYITTGTEERPKVYLKTTSADSVEVLLYSSGHDDVTAEVGLICRPVLSNGGMMIPDRLYDAVIMQAAAETLLVLREPHAENLFNRALIMMGAKKETNKQ